MATEEGEQEYVNIDAIPENLLDAEMIVSAIEARDSKIVLYLKKNEIVKNDLNADWVKEEVGRTGVEPGFSKIISQIKGGNDIMKIPFSPPDITEKEIEQVSEALRSGWITTGPKTKELEREVADLCGVNRAVCLNSQTACAEMTLRLLGIKEGDEVITCAYTYTASASVVCHVGAKLILIDTQRDCLEMDYEQLENAITEKTKVIIPVDLGGVPCDYDRIFSIVERKKDLFHPANKIQKSIGRVIVMADAAHAFWCNLERKTSW